MQRIVASDQSRKPNWVHSCGVGWERPENGNGMSDLPARHVLWRDQDRDISVHLVEIFLIRRTDSCLGRFRILDDRFVGSFRAEIFDIPCISNGVPIPT